MEIRCLIVDDETPAVDELRFILSGIDGVDIIGSAHSAGSAIRAVQDLQPDLVFLDIKMPGRDGFDVIRACTTFPKIPFFVFATAYDEHAVKAFDASAVDYLLKPFQAKRVGESVMRVRKLLLDRQQGLLCGQLERLVERIHPAVTPIDKISVEHKGRILLLDLNLIVYFKAQNKTVLAFTDHQRYSLHGAARLDSLESRLDNQGFFRSHRGYLVNLSCVTEVVPWFNGTYILKTTDRADSEIPVSRRRVKTLKKRLGL